MSHDTYHGGRYDFSNKPVAYAQLAQELTALLANENDRVANAANTSALIYDALPDLNWAGFYFMQGDGLLVGPFQGKPACVRIGLHEGVCGAAASQRKTQLVYDVHEFPGHIACDAASRSEIVIPLIDRSGRLFGVLDLDSPKVGRFDIADQAGLEDVARIFIASLEDAS